MNPLILLSSLLSLLVVVATPAGAAVVSLYAGGISAQPHPSQQGWIYATSPFFGAHAQRGVAGGGSTLDTTSVMGESAGYFAQNGLHPALPTLNRNIGFILDFSLRLDAESHLARDDNGDGWYDRGGYSVLVVTQDLRAIELAFWTGTVWAYEDNRRSNSAFTHAESGGVANGNLLNYSLAIKDDRYTLGAGGKAVLGGPLRDYRFFQGTPDPYEMPSLLFFGDDTSSAASRSLLTSVSIRPIPLPPAALLFGTALAGLGWRSWRRPSAPGQDLRPLD